MLPAGRERVRVRDRPESVPERLPPLPERGPDDGEEETLVSDLHARGGKGSEPDDGRVDLGGRRECPRCDLEENLRVHGVLHGEREGAVVLRSGGRRDPVGHLLLEHEHEPGEARALLDEPHEDRHGDIVGEVRHGGRSGREAVKRKRQCVAADEMNIRQPPQIGLERRDEPAVEFDGEDSAGGAGDVPRQISPPGTDLEDRVAGREPGRIDDLPEDVRVREKVLAERLLRRHPGRLPGRGSRLSHA